MLRRLLLNEWVILIAIVLNSIILFLLSFSQLEHSYFLFVLDYGFTIFFLVEIGVKISYFGFKAYMKDPWDRFDFIVIALSLPSLIEPFVPETFDLSFLLILRLFRVSRAFRLMRFIPRLDHLVAGVKRALKSAIFVITGLVIYNFLLAVLSCQLFKVSNPDYFGDPITAGYSIFRVFTIEGWNEIPDAIAKESGFWTGLMVRAFFVGVVLTGGMLGFSIVNAIFVDEMTQDNTNELEKKVEELSGKIDDLMDKIDRRNEES